MPNYLADVTLGASGLWLGTRTGAGGTATLAYNFFFAANQLLHGQQDTTLCGVTGTFKISMDHI